GRIKLDSKNVYWVNSLTYSRNPFYLGQWAMGYGVKKMFFNRSDRPGMSEYRFLSYGMDVNHVNFSAGEITKSLSLLSRAKLEVGTRLAPKLYGIYLFAGVTYNCYWTDTQNTLAPAFLKISNRADDYKLDFWPGLVFGVMIHG
ncbi:MAG: hypothetical protein ACKOE6_16090, partial [Flammeovirgaceae bacterium]